VAIPSQKDIEAVARDVLKELGVGPDPAATPRDRGKALVSEGDVRAAKARGEKVLVVPEGAIVTPLARDAAFDNGVEIRIGNKPGYAPPSPAAKDGPAPDAGPAPQEGGRIALGADHGGFALKQALKAHLDGRKLEVVDVGTHSTEAVDYPDVAAKVAKAVALGEASWGILVDGAGIGSCMAANKVPGVLAATCHDEKTAKNSREHNGANVLCLGSGSLDEPAARRVVDAWLATGFGGGRHGKRVAKIKAIEKGFTR
jgi:ribose 5-phosphate isomerase B